MTGGALSVAACNVSDYQVKPAPQGPGVFHFQNAGLPAAPVDVYLDNAKIVSSLAFGDTASVPNLPYGPHGLKFTGTTDTVALAASPIFISTSRMYTEALGGDAAGIGGLAMVGGQVSLASVSPATNAGLRIYNTVDSADYAFPTSDSTWVGNLGITLTGLTTGFTVTTVGVNQFNSAPLLTNGQAAAGYQPLPPDTYSLVIFNSDANSGGTVDTLVSSGITITLHAGELRTAVLAGFGLGTPKPAVRLLPAVADSGQ
jgi:hypothetical protein